MDGIRLSRRFEHTLLRQLIASATFASLLLAAASPTAALDIVFNYNLNPTGDVEMAPSFDPDGSKLLTLANLAAQRWENIILDTATLEIELYWSDLADEPDFNPLADAITRDISDQGLPETGRIRFDGFNRDAGNNLVEEIFYLDETPLDDEEFLFAEPMIFRDLSPQQKLDQFSGNTPEVLEVQQRYFRGPGAPEELIFGYDAVSILLHEVGHILGVGGTPAILEAGPDIDYDLDPDLLGGAVTAVNAYAADNVSHLASESLMHPFAVKQYRVDISATDVLAVQAGRDALASQPNLNGPGWALIKLPRTHFLGGDNLTLAANWVGNRTPDGAVDAYIRRIGPGNAPNATFSAPTFFTRNLFILEGAQVDTEDRKIFALGDTVIDPRGDPVQTRLNVGGGGELETKSLDVLGGAFLIVGGPSGGGTVTVNDTFNIGDADFGSFVIARGVIDVQNELNNEGELQTGGDLTLNTSNFDDEVWNLGGDSRTGRVSVGGGNLTVNGQVAEFNGSMTINSNRTATFNNGLTIGPTGNLLLNGATQQASLVSNHFSGITVNGTVVANGDAFIDSRTTFFNTAVVDIPDNTDTLRLGSANGDAINFNGGTITGNGLLDASGQLFANSGSSTISVREFDWDGSNDSATTTIAPGGTLTIDVNSFADPHDTTIFVLNNGTLNVDANTTWQVAGDFHITGGIVNAHELALQAGSTFEFSAGELTVEPLFLLPGSSQDWTGGKLNVETISGSITNNGGTLGTYESTSQTLVTGTYVQLGDSVLEVEIAGPDPGIGGHDRYNVQGNAALAGVLDVSLLDGYLPLAGQQFEVLTAATVINNGLTLGGDAADIFDLIVNATSVVLEALNQLLVGDYNEDGIVNAADYVVWRNHQGQEIALPNEDPAATPGMVTLEDYNVWVTNFGETTTNGSAAGNTLVPEPASCAIAMGILAALGILRIRRPR